MFVASNGLILIYVARYSSIHSSSYLQYIAYVSLVLDEITGNNVNYHNYAAMQVLQFTDPAVNYIVQSLNFRGGKFSLTLWFYLLTM